MIDCELRIGNDVDKKNVRDRKIGVWLQLIRHVVPGLSCTVGARIRNHRENIECELEVVEYVIFREAWIELRYVKAPRFSTSNLTWLAEALHRRKRKIPKAADF